MAEAKLKIDTSELDEAIVKAKILKEELEKAKSIINDIANSNNNQIEYALLEAEPSSNVLSDSDIDRIIESMRRAVERG
jgi:phosphatidylinositol kinase/protein kinase (PI-3  family)